MCTRITYRWLWAGHLGGGLKDGGMRKEPARRRHCTSIEEHCVNNVSCFEEEPKKALRSKLSYNNAAQRETIHGLLLGLMFGSDGC